MSLHVPVQVHNTCTSGYENLYLIAVVIRYETPEDALHLSGRDCKREWLGLTGLQSSGFVTSDGLESSSQVVIVLLASLLCVAHD